MLSKLASLGAGLEYGRLSPLWEGVQSAVKPAHSKPVSVGRGLEYGSLDAVLDDSLQNGVRPPYSKMPPTVTCTTSRSSVRKAGRFCTDDRFAVERSCERCSSDRANHPHVVAASDERS